MLNLIKMDLYRMVHTVSVWILLVFVLGIAAFCVSMTNLDLAAMEEDVQYAREMETEMKKYRSVSTLRQILTGLQEKSAPVS